MPIDLHFPTTIYHDRIDDYEKLNATMLKKINDIKNSVPKGGNGWLSDMYNTSNTYNLVNDKSFAPLLAQITSHVNQFARQIGGDPKRHFRCVDSWVNICRQGDYQDMHFHVDSTFSGVYYVTAPTGSANIVFDNPTLDIHPIPLATMMPVNYSVAEYSPDVGKFFIFRSHLRHSVKQHKIPEDRISIAFNFD